MYIHIHIYIYIYILYIYIYISEFQNLGVEITAPNSALHYENLPELPPGFLHAHPFSNTPIIKDKRILIFCGKKTDSLSSL